MAEKFDAIVIGGGHNGLVAAAYLARARRRVLLLEASEALGGALATSEISPDYLVSTAAHLIEAMPRRIEKDLRLAKHGLRFPARVLPTILLARDRRHLRMTARRHDRIALREWYGDDAAAHAALMQRIASYAKALAPLLGQAAPLSGGAQTAHRVLRRLFRQVYGFGSGSFEALLHELPGSIGDLAEQTFETEALKALVAFEAVRGTAEGPFSPGTVFSLIYRQAMRQGALGPSVPLGGVGGLIGALAAAAHSLGVTIRVSSPVAHIRVENGAVRGVELQGGEFVEAPSVLSSADPRHTMLDLLGAQYCDAGLASQVARIGMRGATAKLNLALDGLPTIQGLEPAEYGARLLALPSLAELDQAYVSFKRGEVAFEPPMEVTLPSVNDASLAPPGQHVMSILVQYVPYEVRGGWAGQRDRLLGRIIDTLSVHAPDLRQRIVAGELLLPADIERKFGLPGGGWNHSEMRPDQLLMFRPTPGLAGMRTPLKGLYLCGAGAHPGGGISGVPGRLAAGLAIADEARR